MNDTISATEELPVKWERQTCKWIIKILVKSANRGRFKVPGQHKRGIK